MSSNNIYYVYIYHDPENMKPFYVGKGKGRRYKEHLHEAKRKPFPCNNRKLNKIRKILKSGVDPVISFYLMDVTESVANLCEISLIRRYGRLDNHTGILTNKTDGGDGLSGHIPNAETRRKLSIAGTGEKNGMYGKKHSDETKAAFSLTRKGKKVSESHHKIIKNTAHDRRQENSWLQAKKNPLYDRFESYDSFKNEVIEMYHKYLKSPTLITVAMNVTYYPVATMLKHLGYDVVTDQTLTKLVKNYGLRWLSVDDYHNDILKLHNTGMSYCCIARTLNVNPYGVKKYIDTLQN